MSQPLNDLGAGEYVRLEGGPTGFSGGLYPDGSNLRPAAHAAAGLALAGQILPRNSAGNPDPAGKIVMISVGMSNTGMEFRGFRQLAINDSALNPSLVLVNGAQPGMVATEWVDPNAPAWQFVDNLLQNQGLAPQQVQVAWVKLTNYDLSAFPQAAQDLQQDLEAVAHNLKTRYPNVRIAYFSSRTRSYTYWQGLNPEPGAFETGFAVKWMIEKQINGDASLNYDPAKGPAVAPWLSWGPYLWIDGLNPRSDGMVWPQADLIPDCTHPSDSGVAKVAIQLMSFFKNDVTARSWFLIGASDLYQLYVPFTLSTGSPGFIQSR